MTEPLSSASAYVNQNAPIAENANDNHRENALINGSMATKLLEKARFGPAQVEMILNLQKEQGLTFGEAAISLGLLTTEDIINASVPELVYPFLADKDNTLSQELLAAYQPFSSCVESLRALRGQLFVRWFGSEDASQKVLAIVSAGAGEGRSFIAANLAIVCSQMGDRTLLIDADFRRPRQHALFKLAMREGLAEVLTERVAPLKAVTTISGLVGLSVISTGQLSAPPLDLLRQEKNFAQMLNDFKQRFDVIIVDTPADSEHQDAQIIAQHCGGALLIARNHQTSVPKASRLVKGIRNRNVVLVGSFLNNG